MNWNNIFREKSKTWILGKIPNPQDRIVLQNEEYISVKLRSMRIDNVRKGFNTYYGVLNSNISLSHTKEGMARFNTVAKPCGLEKLDAKRLDSVVQVNISLMQNMPFRGGGLELEIGLFSIQEQNLSEPYITLLTDLSALGGTSFVQTAMQFAGPIAKGFNAIVGNDATILEIGLSTQMNEPITGCYYLIKAEASKLDTEGFTIGEDARLLDKNGNNFEAASYFVFEISTSSNRPDFFAIPDVARVFNIWQEAGREGDFDKTMTALAVLKRTVQFSPDLIRKDANNLCRQFDNDMTDSFPDQMSKIVQYGAKAYVKMHEIKPNREKYNIGAENINGGFKSKQLSDYIL